VSPESTSASRGPARGADDKIFGKCIKHNYSPFLLTTTSAIVPLHHTVSLMKEINGMPSLFSSYSVIDRSLDRMSFVLSCLSSSSRFGQVNLIPC
jgi:hypothetical protein